uniref:asparaginase n=1 Tax=Globodera rostochiensis TaxID=31243 RepID=A0A914I3Z7_GLORO
MSDEISTILSHHHRQHHAAPAAAAEGDGAAATARSVPPVSAPSPPMPPIDHSFQPKHLTAVANLDDSADDEEGNLVRNLSATTLAEMHAEREANGIPPPQQQQQQQQQQHTGRRRLSTVCEDGHAHGKMVALHDSKVLVLYTGGTIGMRTCPAGVYAPEQHYLPRAIRDIPPLNDKEYAERMYADLPLKPLCLPPVRGMSKRVVYWVVEYEPLLDSSDMTFDDWIRIAKDIRKSYSAYDGFVVLHGTDTLAYTACALSFMMENLGKPVVITGAQIPVAEVRSDGRENMIGALIVAGNLDIPEVCVLFNNKLLRGNRSIKVDTHGLEAFDSPNMAPLATLDISINVNYESIFRSGELRPFTVQESLCRNVVVLRIFPSMPIESVRALLRAPTQGVVLQTYGSGNIPLRREDILREVRTAVERGCLVVNVSQCAKGQVATSYMTAKILDDAGVIFGSDMTTEAALAKLAYVLAKQEWSIEQKAAMLRKNLAGELSVAHSDAQLVGELDIIPRLAKYLSITSSSETRMLRNALFPPLSCHAAFANDVQTLENLRLSGANLSGGDYNMRTPLHVANIINLGWHPPTFGEGKVGDRGSSGVAAVEYLLKHGASVHIRDANDENALICAVRSRNLVAIKMVRQAGGQLVLPRPRIGVELCLSAGSGDLEALKAWHAAGANLSTTDYDGRTALHVAAARGLDEMCYWLCENGADPLVRDRLGRTPAEDARANIDEHMVEGLRRRRRWHIKVFAQKSSRVRSSFALLAPFGG